ncbi:hypothetical protein V499_09015, partial [Pseudogymnoascus sp. VKM F-103]
MVISPLLARFHAIRFHHPDEAGFGECVGEMTVRISDVFAGEADHGVAEADKGAAEGAERRTERQRPPAERAAMLRVLAADATELPAMVQDLDLRLQEMETLLLHISHHVAAARSAYSATTSAFTLLERLAAALPAYIATSTSFATAWQDAKAALNDQANELANMRTFYEGYLASYDGLVLEVARRHGAERKMKSVLSKAVEQVERLREADTAERKAFWREVGAFLPSDLWEGLVGDAPRWEVG